jgi:phage-related tail fiber protein
MSNLRVDTITDEVGSGAPNFPNGLTGDGSQLAGLSGVPTGTVIYHAANAAPSGFVKANGAALSRTTYADLFAAIGTTYGIGNGSTTFNVPDLRGEFIRGFDDGRGVDAGRAFGSAQADEFKSHVHSNPAGSSSWSGVGSYDALGVNALATASHPDTLSAGGSETRPRNIALLACIKY